MDIETLELLLGEVGSMWAAPMTSDELEAWSLVLRTPGGVSLDPEIAGEALLDLRHTSDDRPTVDLFRNSYEALAARPSDAGPVGRIGTGRAPAAPVEPPTDRPAALEHLAGLRLILAGEAQAAQVFTMAGTP